MVQQSTVVKQSKEQEVERMTEVNKNVEMGWYPIILVIIQQFLNYKHNLYWCNERTYDSFKQKRSNNLDQKYCLKTPPSVTI